MNLELIGKILKKNRCQQGLTLDDISKVTCIDLSKLQAIEIGDASAFPAPIYMKGFIRSYTKALKINEIEINQHLSEPLRVDQFSAQQILKSQNLSFKKYLKLNHLGLFFVMVVSIILIAWAWSSLRDFEIKASSQIRKSQEIDPSLSQSASNPESNVKLNSEAIENSAEQNVKDLNPILNPHSSTEIHKDFSDEDDFDFN